MTEKATPSTPAKAQAKVPMEQQILSALSGRSGLTATGLTKRAHIGKRDRKRFLHTLMRLKKSGKVALRHGLYTLAQPAVKAPSKHAGRPAGRGPGSAQTVEAVVRTVLERFGFVREIDSGLELFIPGRMLMGALPGDRVLVARQPSSGELGEGKIIEILEQADYTFTGVFHHPREGVSFIQVDSGMKGALTVAPGQARGAKDGDKVVARVYKRAQSHRDHKAQVLAVMGSAQDPRACAQAILNINRVHEAFPPQLEDMARQASRSGISSAELSGRRDLRSEPIFTIDSATSKDLDDAVSLEKTENGWLLGVHIADVSHYVRAGDAIDLEAFERGTSIYYADKAIPMLPRALSNGICSLNEGEDRLALSAFITLDEDAEIVRYEFSKSVIRSRVKGVYTEVNAILDGSAAPDVLRKYAGLCDILCGMDALAQILVKKRTARGAVELHSVESQFVFDGQGEITDLLPRLQGRAEKLIEEFMLLANQAAAALSIEKKLPFIYRIHESVPPAKADALFFLLKRLGLTVKQPEGDVRPAVLRDILQSVQGTELEIIVNSQILRSMAKARYSETNVGHYGLTLKQYSHFTSPIRRYPDLAIHRIISGFLEGESAGALDKRYAAFVRSAAEKSSERELRAMMIERSCDSCFMTAYMQKHIGSHFPGTISAAAPHGFYVLLDSSAEGLVHINTLDDDQYEYDGAIALTGKLTGRRYRVGDRVEVMVIRADVSSGEVGFSLIVP